MKYRSGGEEDLDSLDNRTFIKDHLQKHAEAIEEVRIAIQNDKECYALYCKGDNSKRYDDIWILRFILSNKNAESAFKAASKTMKFREEKKLNELGDIRHRIVNLGVVRDSDINLLPGTKEFERYCGENTTMTVLPDPDRGILLYADLGKVDQKGIAENISEEEMTTLTMYYNEAVLQVLDDATRRTGRLTKQMKIIDMGNVKLRQVSRAYIKRDGAASKALEDYYPQLLGAMYIYNSPTWVSALWSALRPFFPERVAEKVDILPSLSKIKKSRGKYLKRVCGFVSEKNLPARYGGLNNEWPLPAAGTHFQSHGSDSQ